MFTTTMRRSLHLMGIDHTRLVYRYAGRDFRLDGRRWRGGHAGAELGQFLGVWAWREGSAAVGLLFTLSNLGRIVDDGRKPD